MLVLNGFYFYYYQFGDHFDGPFSNGPSGKNNNIFSIPLEWVCANILIIISNK